MILLVQEIRITADTNTGAVRSLLESVRDDVTPQLKNLTISAQALVNIDPTLVSEALLKLQECRITGFLQQSVLQAIYASINNSNTSLSLRKLLLDDTPPFLVDPDVLAGAAVKLEKLRARLSSHKLEAVISRLADTEDSRLRQLEVCGVLVSISTLDPQVVAKALTKLESVG